LYVAALLRELTTRNFNSQWNERNQDGEEIRAPRDGKATRLWQVGTNRLVSFDTACAMLDVNDLVAQPVKISPDLSLSVLTLDSRASIIFLVITMLAMVDVLLRSLRSQGQ